MGDSSGWSLSANECPAGQRNAAFGECLAAVQEAAQSAGEELGSGPGFETEMGSGSNFGPMVPPGCSYSRTNKAAIYRPADLSIAKSNSGGESSDEYLRVCVR